MSKKALVTIQVMNKELPIICPVNEKPKLFAAAAYLDKKMQEVRKNSSNVDSNGIVLTAALNIVHELLTLRQQSSENAAKENSPTQLKIFADL